MKTSLYPLANVLSNKIYNRKSKYCKYPGIHKSIEQYVSKSNFEREKKQFCY